MLPTSGPMYLLHRSPSCHPRPLSHPEYQVHCQGPRDLCELGITRGAAASPLQESASPTGENCLPTRRRAGQPMLPCLRCTQLVRHCTPC